MWLALACAALLGACRATSELAIDSDPAGAEVRVDDVVVGTTPMRLPFKDYGTRRITLYKPGYLTNSQLVVVEPPWYATFPIDLVTEVLFPVGWHHVQRFQTTLEPGTGTIASPELAVVLRRAEVLRRAGPEGPKRELASGADAAPPPR
ncbi:MAG: PEGA domain-containing protein [Planctomycetes bacterium]|nr:PEGA domain-containing protein [Planctomycetota bacterium]